MSLTKVTFSMINGAPVNVLDYGAVGNGITDDTAAFQAAFNAGVSVYVPDGEYILSSKITVTNKPFNLQGSGRQRARLVWTNASGGIEVVDNTSGTNINAYRWQICNVTLATTYAGGGTALYLNTSNSQPEPAFTIENVDIRGDDLATDYWTIGIETLGGTVGFITNTYITGQEGTPAAGTKGIYHHEEPGSAAMVQFLTNVDIKFFDIGYHVVGEGALTIEGVTFTGCLIVQCNQCVKIDMSGASYTPPYWAFIGCQFDSVSGECIYIQKASQIMVNNCVFYGDVTASSVPLLQLIDCNDAWISNSYFIDFQTPVARTAIDINSTGYVRVFGCGFQDLAKGIDLDVASTYAIISNDQIFKNVTTLYVNSNLGDTNRISIGDVAVDTYNGKIEISNPNANAFIDFKSAASEDYDCRIQQVSNGLVMTVGGDSGTKYEGLKLTSAGKPIMTEIPSSAAGLPKGSIWYDPADSNRIKFVP